MKWHVRLEPVGLEIIVTSMVGARVDTFAILISAVVMPDEKSRIFAPLSRLRRRLFLSPTGSWDIFSVPPEYDINIVVNAVPTSRVERRSRASHICPVNA
jgi:hypothetical protein